MVGPVMSRHRDQTILYTVDITGGTNGSSPFPVMNRAKDSSLGIFV